MEERIKARLEEVKAEREKVLKDLQRQAEQVLAPYNAVIAELEELIKEPDSQAESAIRSEEEGD